MTLLLAGATGALGRRVAGELARSDQVEHLILSSRDEERARDLARLLGGSSGRVTGMALNLTDINATIEALRGVDVFVSCAGPGYLLEKRSVKAAVTAGVPYVSLCDDHSVSDELIEMSAAAIQSGVTIVSGCGISPGVTNMLVATAAKELDSFDEVEIAVAVSAAEADGEASALHLLHQFTVPAPMVAESRLTTEPAGGPARLVYFPEPVGWVETFRCGHPEVLTLHASDRGLRSVEYHFGLTEKVAMDVVRASVVVGMGRTESARRMWLGLSGPMRGVVTRVPPRGPRWSAARVDLWGIRDGRRASVSLGVVDHLANLASASIAHAAMELGTRKTPAGILPAEEAFDPELFLGALARRGLRFARLEPELV